MRNQTLDIPGRCVRESPRNALAPRAPPKARAVHHQSRVSLALNQADNQSTTLPTRPSIHTCHLHERSITLLLSCHLVSVLGRLRGANALRSFAKEAWHLNCGSKATGSGP